MSDRWLVLGTVATIGAALAAAIAQAGPRTERFALDSNVPRVIAEASVVQDAVSVSVRGVPAAARVRASVDRLVCSVDRSRAVGGAVADSSGRARWESDGALPERLRDGSHVLALSVGGAIIACGSIPAARPDAKPREPRHWGIWSFARQFAD